MYNHRHLSSFLVIYTHIGPAH